MLDAIQSQLTDALGGLIGTEKVYENVDDIPDDRLATTLNILEKYGEDRNQANILRTANRLSKLDSLSEEDIRVGTVQDAAEYQRVDQRILSPHISDEGSHLVRNGDYSRTVMVSGMPRDVRVGYLHELITSNVRLRMSKHIEPRDTQSVRDKLERQLTRVRARIAKKFKKNRTDTHDEERKEQTINDLLEAISAGETKLFDLTIYIEVIGDTEEELNQGVREVIRTLSKIEIDVDTLEDRQLEGMRSAAPVQSNEIRGSSLQHAEAVATSFMPIEPAFYQPSGTLYGFDETGVPIFINRFELHGHAKAVSGAVGSGKTFSVLGDTLGMLQVKPDLNAIFFDPTGDDFVHFAEDMGGQVIKFGGDYCINPMEIQEDASGAVEDPYQDKLRFLENLMNLHFEGKTGITAKHRGILTRVFQLSYHKYGITPDKRTHSNKQPYLQTVLDILEELSKGNKVEDFFEYDDQVRVTDALESRVSKIAERMHPQHAEEADDLLAALEEFQDGGINSNLNGRTNVDLQNRLVTMDMSAFSDSGAMPLMMNVMLDWAYERAKSTPEPMEVVFEEVHYLLDHQGARDVMNLFFRHHRHFETGLTLISQTVTEFIQDEEVAEMYDQCSIKKVFYLENFVDDVVEYFNMTDAEQQFIRNASKGDEHGVSNALLSVSGMGKRQLTIEVSDFERRILDDDEDPWEYLIEYNDLTPEDVKWLDEHDRLEEYQDDIHPEVLQRASL